VDTDNGITLSECSASVYGSSIGYEYYQSNGVNGIQFTYVPGDEVTVDVNVQGMYEQRIIDTSSVVGTLSLDFIAKLDSGVVTCFATLDGEQGEFFGCDGRVESDADYNATYINSASFSGVPKKGYFFYPEGASFLTVWL